MAEKITIRELPKMDASMLQKADKFLEDEKIMSTRTGLRLMIEMMAEEFRALNTIVENQNEQTAILREQQRRIENLERKNIVMFIESHPKVAFLYTIGVIVVVNLIPLNFLRQILFLKLGIPDLLP